MLIPRYSLRAWLIAVSSCAVFFLILGQAYRQQPWAIVVSVSVGALAVMLLFHALMYLIAVSFSRVLSAQKTPALTSRGGLQSDANQQSTPESKPTN